MKKLLILSLLMWGVAQAQTTGYLRYDSVRMERVGGNSELILLNATRNVTGGVLTNLGNGRTAFVTPSGGTGGSGISKVIAQYGLVQVNDSTFKVDTSFIAGVVTAWRLQKIRDSLGALIDTKMPAGNYITALTGDGTATGPGSAVFTLANSGVTAGPYSNPNVTVNAKGIVTAIASGPAVPAQFNPIAGTGVVLTGTYPNITFSASGSGSGNPNSNVGSAYRFAIPNTNNIKTFAAGFGGLMDSATSNQLQYTVDSSTIQKKLSYTTPIVKNNNTLSLFNWSSILPNSVYGVDAAGAAIMRRAAIIDSANRHHNWAIVWDSVNLKHVYQYITGSGGGSTYVPPKLLQFIIGSTPNAPVAGTNTVTHDSLVGKFATLYRDGAEQYYNVATNGYTFDGTGGTLTVNPPWVDGELVKIYRTNTAPDTLSAQPIPASWVDVTYPTQTGLTESPSKVWTGTNSSFGSQGLSGSTLTGTGWYIFKSGSPGSNANGLIGFKTTNSNGDYTTYNFGVYLSEESGHLRVNRVDGGAATAVSGAVYGVGYINYGDYAGVFRDVATGVVTLRTSADKITWTTSYTFGSTSTATLYMLMNPFSGTAIYQPQYKVGP